MRVAICDSEEVYRRSLFDMISQWHKQRGILLRIATYNSSEDLLESIEKEQLYDLIFLGTNFPNELNGMSLARNIRSVDNCTQIVFISEDKKLASQGYFVNALRYLDKPFFQSQIDECLNVVFSQWQINMPDRIVLQSNNSIYVLHTKDILFIEARGNSIVVQRVSATEPYTIRKTLSSMQKILNTNCFVRCHRSFIVNLNYADYITFTNIALGGDHKIPIGKKYRHSTKNAIISFCSL